MRAIAICLLTLVACSQAPAAPPAPPPVPAQAAATRDSTTSRSDIKAIQGRLVREGYYPGTVDGVWGPATESAVKLWQRNHGLPQSGKLDAATLNSFNTVPDPSVVKAQ